MGLFDSYRSQGGLLGLQDQQPQGGGMSPSPGFSAVLDGYAGGGGGAPAPAPQPAPQAPQPQAPSMASLGASVDPVADQERRAADMLSRGYSASGITPTDLAVARANNIAPIDAAAARRYVGGQAAVTQEDLMRRNAQSVLVRTGGGTSTVGANRYNPDDIADLSQQRKLAGIQSNEAQQQVLDADVAGQQLTAGQLASAAASRQAEYGAKSAGLQNDLALARKEEADVAGEEVNPNRFFASKGKLATAMLILSSGLEKFANIKAGISGPTLVQQMIARDIAEQERSIVARGAKARNRLGELYKQTGDLNDAKLRLEQEQKGALLAKMQASIAAAKAPAMKAQLEANLAEMLADQTGKRMDMDAANRGVTTETAQGAYLQPHAARAGGWQYDPRALAAASKDERKFRTETQMKTAEIEGKKQTTNSDRVAEYTKRRMEVAKAAAQGRTMLQQMGAYQDENGEWHAPPGGVDGMGIIRGRIDPTSLLSSLFPEGGRENQQAVGSFANSVLRAETGAEARPDEAVKTENRILGNRSSDDVVRGIARELKKQELNIQQVNAAYPDEAREFERRLGREQAIQRQQREDAAQAQQWTPNPVAPR